MIVILVNDFYPRYGYFLQKLIDKWSQAYNKYDKDAMKYYGVVRITGLNVFQERLFQLIDTTCNHQIKTFSIIQLDCKISDELLEQPNDVDITTIYNVETTNVDEDPECNDEEYY